MRLKHGYVTVYTIMSVVPTLVLSPRAIRLKLRMYEDAAILITGGFND